VSKCESENVGKQESEKMKAAWQVERTLRRPDAGSIRGLMMNRTDSTSATTRRDVIQWAAAATVTAVGGSATAAADGSVRAAAPATKPGDPKARTLLDRLWIWTHAVGSYKQGEYGLPQTSRMTPVEGAVYLGVHNLLFIRYGGNRRCPLTSTPSRFGP